MIFCKGKILYQKYIIQNNIYYNDFEKVYSNIDYERSDECLIKTNDVGMFLILVFVL